MTDRPDLTANLTAAELVADAHHLPDGIGTDPEPAVMRALRAIVDARRHDYQVLSVTSTWGAWQVANWILLRDADGTMRHEVLPSVEAANRHMAGLRDYADMGW